MKDYAIFMLDPHGRVATWNAGAERLKGYTAAEIVGRHFSAFYPKEAIERGWPEEELRRATADGRLEDEGWRVRKDGTTFWANVVITALRDEAGVLRGFAKVTRDLTERRAAEENARRLAAEEAARLAAEAAAREVGRQREQLRVTLESIGDAVVVTDAAGAVTFLNPVAAVLTGWGPADAVGRPLAEVFRIVHEGTREPVESPVATVFRENRVVELANHTALLARDGREFPIEDSAAPIPGDGGAVGGAVLVFRDVTGRKRQDAALRASEARFRELADAMPQVVYALRPDGSAEYVNRRWHEYTGLPEGEPFDLARVIHPDDLPALLRAGEEGRAAGRGFEAEFRLRRHDGEYRWFLTRSVPAGGGPARWYGTSTDIHDLKRAEERLRDEHRAVETLLAVGTRLAAELDLDKLIQAVTDETTALTGAAFGAFFYNATDDKGDSLTAVHPVGGPAGGVRAVPPPAGHRRLRADVPGHRDGPAGRRDGRPAVRKERAVPRHAGRATCRSGATWPCRSGRGPGRCSAGCSSATPRPGCSPPGTSGWPRGWRPRRRWRSTTPGCSSRPGGSGSGPSGGSGTPGSWPTPAPPWPPWWTTRAPSRRSPGWPSRTFADWWRWTCSDGTARCGGWRSPTPTRPRWNWPTTCDRRFPPDPAAPHGAWHVLRTGRVRT